MDERSITSVHEYENETWSRCASSYLDTFSGLTNQMLGKLVDITNYIYKAGSLTLKPIKEHRHAPYGSNKSS